MLPRRGVPVRRVGALTMFIPDDPVALKALLFATARKLLSLSDGPQKGPIYVEVSNRRSSRLCLSTDEPAPSGDLGVGPRATAGELSDLTELITLLAGVCFSPTERRIVLAIGERQMSGPRAAEAAGIELDTRLKLILANLADRTVLRKGDGYRVSDRRLLHVAQDTSGSPA